MADILGSINGETLDGTEDADIIHADAGDDIVNGMGGDDLLYGEGDNDTLNGGDGADQLRGGPGNDLLHGDAGDDFLAGAGGNDLLDGGDGDDRITLFDGTGTFGVSVDLRLDGTAQDFGAFGMDTLFSIEQVLSTYGSDTLTGNDASNWFMSFGSNDTLTGNGGDDYFTVGDQDKVIDGGDGSDTAEIDDTDSYTPLYTSAGVNVSLLLQGQAQAVGTGNWTLNNIENLSGNWGNDTFTGDANDNILAGAGGDDTLDGGGGNDTLMGDGAMLLGYDPSNPNRYQFAADISFIPAVIEGNDTLHGGAGNDTLYGGGGNDLLYGDADSDTLWGGAGADQLRGGPGDDALHGEAGDDFLAGAGGNDLLDGGDGDDRITLFDGSGTFGVTVDLRLENVAQDFGAFGMDTLVSIEQVMSTYGSDTLIGNEAGNWLYSFGGNDTLTGNGGDDYFTVGDQDKVIDGGDGSDTLEFDDSDAIGPLYTAAGVNVSLLLQGQSQAVGTGNWTVNGIENLSGNWGNDTFTGDANANTLAGAGGNDTLDGGDGDDILMGDGAMVYGYDVANPGRYQFQADISSFPGVVEGNDTLTGGAGNDTLFGGGGDDVLHGDDGNDFLDGGTGGDTMFGGAGDDIYIIDKSWDGVSSDGVIENPGEGTDEIRTYVDWGLGGIPDIENLTALGTGNVFLGGNDGANVLTGNDADNYFEAAGGNDTVIGGGGNDIASFQLPVGTVGMPTIVDGTGEDAGKLLVNLVDGDASQTYLKISQSGGVTTIEGVGIGSAFGTDTLTGIEQIHTFVRTADDSPPTQFVAVNLAAQAYGDFVSGSEFDETFDIGDFAGAVNANGNRGNDTITGTDVVNNLSGGAGDDVVNAMAGNDYVEGNDGNDFLNGGADDDYIVGGAGNDSIDGGTGANDVAAFQLPLGTVGAFQIVRGTGADDGTLFVELVNGEVVEQIFRVTIDENRVATVEGLGSAAWMGTDTVTNWDQLHFLVPNDPFDPVQFASVNARFGTAGNDTINSGAQSDVIFGEAGNDTLRGGAGDDLLQGGDGDDLVVGGVGNDRLDGGAGTDRISMFDTTGTFGVTVDLRLDGTQQDFGFFGKDTLFSIEHVTATYGDDTLIGNDAGNWFYSVNGSDNLSGNGGDDYFMVSDGDKVVDGGDGSDTLEFVDADANTAYTAAGNNVSLLLQGQVQALATGNWTISGIENLSGNWGNDTFTGDDNDNSLAGAGGDDTLIGNGGNDTLLGDGGIVVGYDTANPGAFKFLADISDLGVVGGNDTLDGGAGADVLNGGGGDDALTGGADGDTFQISLGHDTVSDFIVGSDKVDVSEANFTGFEQLKPYLSQVGDDVVFSFLYDGVVNTMTLQNVDLNALDQNHFVFASGTDALDDEGTENADVMLGGSNADTLSGLGGDDQLFGYEGNDTLNGGLGNDVVDGGIGSNKLYGEDGDDTLVIYAPLQAAPGAVVVDGGIGTDTLEVRAAPGSPSGLFVAAIHSATFTGIEQIRFDSTPEHALLLAGMLPQVLGSGVTTVIGGAGHDVLLLAALATAGTYSVPDFTLSGWSLTDVIGISGSGNVDVTLNAREGLASTQSLTGAFGNDTLNGSSGTDILDGGAGVNILNAGDGDDTLIIRNSIGPVGLTTFTGAGGVYDGGLGFDVLSVGGEVSFLGSLSGIEGITLQPAFGVAGSLGSQVEAYLEMDLAHFATLPTDFTVSGTGTIDPDINQGESFDFSGVQFAVGSNVTFYFDGESDGAGVPGVTWVGTSNGDYFNFGSDSILATGGGGADVFQLGGTDATVADFTIGEDKIDLSEVDIDTAARLLDFTRQVGNDVVIEANSGGETLHFVLQNTLLTDLSENDVIFAAPGGAQNETGTEFDDILFGYGANDVINGGDGNDRIYSGGGTDTLHGDAGDDTLVLDGQNIGGSFDGGTGTDTLELRTGAPTTWTLYTQTTGYKLAPATVSGIEKVHFVSDIDTGVGASMFLGQINGSGLTELIGGDGLDTLVVVVAAPTTGGTFTMPNFTLTDWHSSATPYTNAGDGVALFAATNANYVLNAREGLASTQALFGNTGNDTLNGSSGVDILQGNGGSDVLNGNDGDDVLVIANTVTAQGQLPNFTGAGSTFNGGAGFDTLSIAGVVNFAGTLADIEGIFLQPAFVSPDPLGAGTQAAAVLSFDGDLLASLPADLALSGSGTVNINLGADAPYDATGWTIAAEASVIVNVIGSDGDDTMVLGAFAENVTGGDEGIDTAVFAGNSADYVVAAGLDGSLTIGDDTLVNVELFQFDDGVFFWNGTSLISAVSEGLVADGYVAGATVYIDANNNGTLDVGEPSTITDANGDFTLVSPFVGPLRAFGGTNIDTGLPNTVQFSATEGATVINPLTTLVQSLVESGQAADGDAAQTAVKTAFGIDAGIDLANVDLIQAATDDPALALTAHQAAASVAAVLSVVNNVGGNTTAALGQLTTIVAGGGTVDLTDSSTLTQVVNSGVTGGTVDVSTVVTVVQGSTQDIASATSVSEVTAAQQNSPPTANADTGSVDEDAGTSAATRAAGVLGNDTDPDTGETSLLRVTQVTGAGAATNVATTGNTSIAGTYGTLQVAADGTYAYTADLAAADALAAGASANEVFTYRIVDPSGQQATATLTFTVTGVDDAAVAKDDAVTTAEDTTAAGSLFADNGSGADSDVDNATLSIASVNGDAGNVGTQITLASGALLTVNADGSYSYDPNGQFDALAAFGSGAANTTGADSFTYTLANGNTATVTVSIHGVASAGDRMAGSTGDDAIAGTSGNDIIMLQDGGQDSASGGEGDDGFYMGAELSYDDHIDGGAGTDDQLGLQGTDYGSPAELHELGPENLLGIEMLVLLSGSDTRFGDTAGNLYSYHFQTDDANVAAGERLVVSWNTLLTGEDVTMDGSAENDGYFLTYGGHGNDAITGGQQDDGFYFGTGPQGVNFGAGDSIDGQGGFDQLGLQGDYTGANAITFGASQLSGVEMIVALSGADTRFGGGALSFAYDLTTADGNVAAGETLAISANTLRAGETLTFDGSAETDGTFIVYGGEGNDTASGGAGDDTIFGGDGADTLTGGGGNDLFAYASAAHSDAVDRDHIVDFAAGDRIDLSSIDAASGTSGEDDPFTFVGTDAFSNTAGELRYEAVSGNDWLVQGDLDGDGVSDFEAIVTITDGHTLAAGDFVL